MKIKYNACAIMLFFYLPSMPSQPMLPQPKHTWFTTAFCHIRSLAVKLASPCGGAFMRSSNALHKIICTCISNMVKINTPELATHIYTILPLLHKRERGAYGFIEAIMLPESARLLIIGDIHGDYESLNNNIETMQHLGYMDASLTLQPHYHLAFTGDLADRGNHGQQVWETIIRLLHANPKQIHIIRGNHETHEIAQKFGFLEELKQTHGSKHKSIYRAFLKLFKRLPLAICFGFQTYGQKEPTFVMCCHGGIEQRLTEQCTQAMLKAQLDGQSRVCFTAEQLDWDQNQLCALDWGDFHATEDEQANQATSERISTGGVFTHNKAFATRYMALFRGAGLHVCAIVRGHQHVPGGITALRPTSIQLSTQIPYNIRQKLQQFRPILNGKSELIEDGNVYTCTSAPRVLESFGCQEDAFTFIESTAQGLRLTPHIRLKKDAHIYY